MKAKSPAIQVSLASTGSATSGTGSTGASGLDGTGPTGLVEADPKVLAVKAKVSEGKRKLEELDNKLSADLSSEDREKVEKEKEALNRSIIEEEVEVNNTKAKRKMQMDEDKLQKLKDAARNETNPIKKKLLQKIAAKQQNETDIAEAENKKAEEDDKLRKMMGATGGIDKKALQEQLLAVKNASDALNKTVTEEKPRILDLDVGKAQIPVLHPDMGGPKSSVETPKHFKKREFAEMVNNETSRKPDTSLSKPAIRPVQGKAKAKAKPCINCQRVNETTRKAKMAVSKSTKMAVRQMNQVTAHAMKAVGELFNTLKAETGMEDTDAHETGAEGVNDDAGDSSNWNARCP